MFGSILSVFLAGIAVGLLILIHEAGHFFAAKAVGVRVEVFSIGFWKKIVSFQRGETEYRISIIPLGGYVKLAGESPEEATGEPDEFWSKTPGQRSLVFVAGVGMNMILALLGFIAAFAVGVPFTVAEIGSLQKSMPAWEAGMKVGDEIVRVNGVKDPDFQDVTRQVALKGLEEIPITVRRNQQRKTFTVAPEYDKSAGIRRIGFRPPMTPVVTGLLRVKGEKGRCPAREAGIEMGDRILSVNGRKISAARELSEALRGKLNETVKVVFERDGKKMSANVKPATPPRYKIGISCVSTEITALQGDGMAKNAGLKVGDRITAVDDHSVTSVLGMDDYIQRHLGDVTLKVIRGEKTQEKTIHIPDREALGQFLFSFDTSTSNKLSWVLEGGPAWKAGMRVGDRIVGVGGESVASWDEILRANHKKGESKRMITWIDDGQEKSARVTPTLSPMNGRAQLGVVFDRPRRRIREYGVVGAVREGTYKTYASMVDIVLTIKGFMSQEVSTKNVGGVVLIAYSSYRAAEQGLGKLLYLMAIISGALAFLNILPIPVLDGGHLMFEGIEKIRGKPVSNKVRGISQTIGMVLLLSLVVYAIRNDLVRLFDFF